MDEQLEAELTAKLIDAPAEDQLVPVPSRPLLTPNQLAAIARDIAINVYEIPVILEKYGVTQAQFATHVHPNGYFQSLLQSYAAEWESIKSTNKRLAFQAAAALEESLPALAHRMGSKSEDFADAIGAAKLFTQLAGAGAAPGSASIEPGQRFSIQINIGDRTVAINSAQETPVLPESEGHTAEVLLQPTPESTRDDPPMVLLPAGSGVVLPVGTDPKQESLP